MPERRLLIDLGNSRLKWIWTLGAQLDAGSAGEGDPSDLARTLEAAEYGRPEAVLLSSVARAERTEHVAGLCQGLLGLECRRLASRAEQAGVRNGYPEPSRLGVDRWLALIGAVHHHGKPVVVWDLGTATTLDAVNAEGLHLGGWILPGPATMLAGLAAHTRLEVPPDLGERPNTVPGKATADAITGGIVAAQIGALERFLGAVAELDCRSPSIVATGGAAPQFAALREDVLHDRWAVFRGMQLAGAEAADDRRPQ